MFRCIGRIGCLMLLALLALVAWILAVGGSWLALKLSTSQVGMPYWRLKMDVRLLGILAAVALLTPAGSEHHHDAVAPIPRRRVAEDALPHLRIANEITDGHL